MIRSERTMAVCMFWNPRVDYNNLFRDPSKFILLVRNCERFGSWLKK